MFENDNKEKFVKGFLVGAAVEVADEMIANSNGYRRGPWERYFFSATIILLLGAMVAAGTLLGRGEERYDGYSYQCSVVAEDSSVCDLWSRD